MVAAVSIPSVRLCDVRGAFARTEHNKNKWASQSAAAATIDMQDEVEERHVNAIVDATRAGHAAGY